MARVAVTFKILPDDAQADLGPLQNGLREVFGEDLKEVVERPIAFGLTALEAIVVLDDAGGQLDRAEEAIAALEGVGTVDTQAVDLV